MYLRVPWLKWLTIYLTIYFVSINFECPDEEISKFLKVIVLCISKEIIVNTVEI